MAEKINIDEVCKLICATKAWNKCFAFIETLIKRYDFCNRFTMSLEKIEHRNVLRFDQHNRIDVIFRYCNQQMKRRKGIIAFLLEKTKEHVVALYIQEIDRTEDIVIPYDKKEKIRSKLSEESQSLQPLGIDFRKYETAHSLR